jgi:hypothetical protein
VRMGIIRHNHRHRCRCMRDRVRILRSKPRRDSRLCILRVGVGMGMARRRGGGRRGLDVLLCDEVTKCACYLNEDGCLSSSYIPPFCLHG